MNFPVKRSQKFPKNLPIRVNSFFLNIVFLNINDLILRIHCFILKEKNIEIYFWENLEKQFSSRIFDENIILNNRNWIRKMLNPRCFKLFCEFCDFCVSTFKHDRPCSKNEILENLGKYSNSTLQSVSFKKTSNKYFYATFFNQFMSHKLWRIRLSWNWKNRMKSKIAGDGNNTVFFDIRKILF